MQEKKERKKITYKKTREIERGEKTHAGNKKENRGYKKKARDGGGEKKKKENSRKEDGSKTGRGGAACREVQRRQVVCNKGKGLK